MASKGNGVAKTNELLVQILGELGAIRKGQVELRKTVEEQGRTLHEHGQILREHGETLKHVEGDIRDMKGEIREMKSDIRQLNTNMAQIARFVGDTQARQDREIQDIRVRVEALERRAA